MVFVPVGADVDAGIQEREERKQGARAVTAFREVFDLVRVEAERLAEPCHGRFEFSRREGVLRVLAENGAKGSEERVETAPPDAGLDERANHPRTHLAPVAGKGGGAEVLVAEAAAVDIVREGNENAVRPEIDLGKAEVSQQLHSDAERSSDTGPILLQLPHVRCVEVRDFETDIVDIGKYEPGLENEVFAERETLAEGV